MIRKVFILTQFGSPHSWTKEYINNVQHLGKYGWDWIIFTPNDLKSKGNVQVVNMDIDEFNALVEAKLGTGSNLAMSPLGIPDVHMTDYCVAWGAIFEEYIRGYDYWGIPNWDIVYGRLDKFIPDSELEQYDVWTDDVNIINGIFCLFRNVPEINFLFTEIENWRGKIGKLKCPRCITGHGDHKLFGTDEYDMTQVMRKPEILEKIKYGHPEHYPIHSHDRLENHVPYVKLRIEKDHSLWELYEDIGHPDWEHAHPMLGREIPYFHFIRTKEWPECLRLHL